MLNTWYLNRLKTMSPSEIPYRMFQLVTRLIQPLFLKFINPSQNIKSVKSKILPVCDLNHPITDSKIQIFGKNFDYSKDINWHKDIFSGKDFVIEFSKSINIRKNPELSAKNVWEINRLEFLSHIAINYKLSGDDFYLDEFIRIIRSWKKSNPYLLGINWYSNIEVNIRLINWFFCWEILDVDNLVQKNNVFKDFTNTIWLPLIYQHCMYSFSNPSKYSSANNHLISEYSGLFLAASKWKFKESSNWLLYSKNGLEIEIQRQHSNGINKEEAAEYIQFITDFFLLPYLVGQNTDNPFSKEYLTTLNSIFEYIYEFTDVKGNFPKYGDEDDGKVICLSNDPHFDNFKSLMISASILFQDSRFKSKSSIFDLKNEVLFGVKGRSIFQGIEVVQNNQNSKFYKNEGHFIFRKQNNKKEIYLHFDAAPLGFLSIAAHGHSDALSFLLHVNGFPIFIDSGTYSYHVSKRWREYFVSTMAHNTVCIDNKNQAKQVGDTMWLNHYQCTVLESSNGAKIESVNAIHSGYKNVTHKRKIEFLRDEDSFRISDEIQNNDGENHDIMILFHLNPDITISEVNGNKILLSHPSNIKLSLEFISVDCQLNIVKGQEKPILGWYSDSFMKKRPTSVISYSTRTNSSINFSTRISILNY